jgi:hypothetical protein
MKPAWDELMGVYADSTSAVVADVDCTAEGKSLCEEKGVKGYPSVKYGDPSDLQDYQGGRDADSLKKFAEENLKPMCSPNNIELCDDEKKAEITKYQTMPDVDLATAIETEEKKLADAEETFKEEVQGLQKKYEELTKAKEATMDAVKNSGLGLMKSVRAAAEKAATTGGEEL